MPSEKFSKYKYKDPEIKPLKDIIQDIKKSRQSTAIGLPIDFATPDLSLEQKIQSYNYCKKNKLIVIPSKEDLADAVNLPAPQVNLITSNL